MNTLIKRCNTALTNPLVIQVVIAVRGRLDFSRGQAGFLNEPTKGVTAMNRKVLTTFASIFVLACAMVCPAGAGGHGGGGHMMSGGAMRGAGTMMGGTMMGGTMMGGTMMNAIGPTGPSTGAGSVACRTGKEHSPRCRNAR
jgi:hypothetical protein